MTNEEKILEMLTQMREDVSGLKEDVSGLKAGQERMEGEISSLKEDISGLKTGQERMEAEISSLKEDAGSLKAGQAQMQEDITRIKLRLDLDVEKRFDAMNEGIDAILEKTVSEKRVKRLEDDTAVLKSAYKVLNEDVAKLKKAQ